MLLNNGFVTEGEVGDMSDVGDVGNVGRGCRENLWSFCLKFCKVFLRFFRYFFYFLFLRRPGVITPAILRFLEVNIFWGALWWGFLLVLGRLLFFTQLREESLEGLSVEQAEVKFTLMALFLVILG